MCWSEVEVVDLFQCPIFGERLVLDNDKILSYCISEPNNDDGRTVSNSGGWQSSSRTEKVESLDELLTSIEKASNEITSFLEIQSVHLENYWININGYKDFNWSHCHAGCVLSGVYYVKVPENSGNILFEHPRSDLMTEWVATTNQNTRNSKSWFFPPKEQTLFIFPSWLTHRVLQNDNKTEKRVSISFNLV